MPSTIKTFSAACALAFVVATTAFAQQAQDVVTGAGKQPIHDQKFGNCVRTKWDNPNDPCATAAPPPPPRVEAPPPPPPPAPEPVAKLEHEELTIYFLFNKASLTPGATTKLDQIADAVNRSPKVTKVNIVGYTDEIGSNSYNNKLSVKRADAVKSYLDTKMRIPSNVLDLRGRGKEDPVVNCGKVKSRKAKIDCMAKDRRVEIEFEFQQ